MPQGFRIQNFGGLVPRIAPELLPDAGAQRATNVKLSSGDLVPYRNPKKLLALNGYAAQTVFPIIHEGVYYWLMWDKDVNVVRAAAANVVNSRVYFTGDGAPKATDVNRATFYQKVSLNAGVTLEASHYEKTLEATQPVTVTVPAASALGAGFAVCVKNASTNAVSISGAYNMSLPVGARVVLKSDGAAWTTRQRAQFPLDWFDLGVAKPATKPTISYPATALTNNGTVTKAMDGTVVEVSGTGSQYDYEIPGQVNADGTPVKVKVTANRITFEACSTLGNQFFILLRNTGTVDCLIDPNGDEAVNSGKHALLKSGESVVVQCNGTSVYTTTTGVYVAYVYTYIDEWGQESPPSDATDLLYYTSGLKMKVAGLPSTPPVSHARIKKYRLYRSVSSTRGTDYLLVKEIDIAAGTNEFLDTVKTPDLKEMLDTKDFDKPDEAMQGVVNMAGGISVGFVGNELCFSEPFAPYAWPKKYRKYAVESPIVAIGAVGNSVIVTTQTIPYVATGNHPSSVTLLPLDTPYPCLSKRGMVDTGQGIMYPSYDGLVNVVGISSKVATAELMTKDEWDYYDPTTMNAVFYRGQYCGFFTDKGKRSGALVIQPSEDGIPLMADTTAFGTAVYADPRTGELYFVADGSLWQWDSATSYSFVDWQSKEMVMTKPVNFGAAQIRADFPSTAIGPPVEPPTINAASGTLNNVENGVDLVNGDALTPIDGPGDTVSGCVFMLYVDGKLKFTRTVTSSKPFRLPMGYRADRYSVRVSAPFRIRAILVGESPTTLQEL